MYNIEFVEQVPKTSRVNYQLMLDKTIAEIEKSDKVPTLLLHSCCAPCSCYVMEYLANYFKITILFYNPNIYPSSEYYRRIGEQVKFNKSFQSKYPVDMIEGDYDTKFFYKSIKGYEQDKEGYHRCQICYQMRLEEAAKVAKDNNFDYFTASLSISPHKDSQTINIMGARLQEMYGVNYLYADFKKKGGFKRSVELCTEYDLYRQDYCGCIYSLYDKRAKDKEKENESKNCACGI